jgi:hypothetical protein
MSSWRGRDKIEAAGVMLGALKVMPTGITYSIFVI